MRITYGAEHITVKIGGVTTDNRLPAGIIRGSCTGPFTEIDEPLSLASGMAAGIAGSGAGRARRYAQP
jgi:hypothetical protein